MIRLNSPSKYRAQATWVDNIRFASKREAARYQELRLMEKAGLIRELDIQPRFPIKLNGVMICMYVGDFRYLNDKGEIVIEDVKGIRTASYKIKAKLMLALYGITILET